MIQSQKIRQVILEQSKRANVGHIGSALSIADIISALYEKVLNIPSLDHAERDRFILSKGHAALALYAALHLKGWLSKEDLNTYCANNTFLGVHPEHHLKGIDFSTGSLGQGLSIGAGCALAAKLKKSTHRTFVLLSDAEMNEGSVWEAVMFAAHNKLSNLIAIIDDNAQQAFGYTKDVLNLSSLSEKWKSFGWDAHNVDGHNVEQISKTIAQLNTTTGAPHVLIAKTTFGKGVSYMESQIKWHYWPMDDSQYQLAIKEIDNQK